MDIKSKVNKKYFLIFIVAMYSLSISLFCLNSIKNNIECVYKPYYLGKYFQSEIVNIFYCVIGKEGYEEDLRELNSTEHIKYYLKFNDTGKIKTNLKNPKELKTYINNSLYTIEFPMKYPNNQTYENISNYFLNKNCKAYFIGMPSNDTSGLLYQYKIFQNVHRDCAICLICLPIGIMLILFLKKKGKLDIEYAQKIHTKYSKIPLDLKVVLFIIFTIFVDGFTDYPIQYKHFLAIDFYKITLVALYCIYLLMGIYELKKFKNSEEDLKSQFNNMILMKIVKIYQNSNISRNLFINIILFFIFTVGIIIAIPAMIVNISDDTIYLVILCIAYIIFYYFVVGRRVARSIKNVNKILIETKKMSEGDLEFNIKIDDTGLLGELADNINNIKNGYEQAVKNEIKSEKFKGELITNVSHDLKTPLTSIINYVKLLQKKDLSEEEKEGYIAVLDRKAERLKLLIEDLFEISKMSSGATEFNMERLNIISLLKQALGELEEKISKSSFDFKVNIPKNEIYVSLDGKKTWRMFENLIENILKYSQENTRVYIDLKEENNKVRITMKNISAYEMNFDPNELFERFKRGDESRSTEGSGLGLAIANSIVEKQGGKMNIFIDGDLFKVVIEFNINTNI